MNTFYKFIVITLAGFILTGCIEEPLTKEENLVRTITPVVAQNCENLGLVKTFRSHIEGGLTSATLQIRREAVRLGGNSIIIISQEIRDGSYAKILAEVYSCKT